MDIPTTQSPKIVARLIVQGSKNPVVRDFTINLIKDRGIAPYPFSLSGVNAIYEFVNQEITYVKDINRVETYFTAENVLKFKYGDCDDKVILAGAMLRSIGMDICIVIIDMLNQKSYEHIFLLVSVNGKWIPFDATMTNGALGKMAQGYKRAKIFYLY